METLINILSAEVKGINVSLGSEFMMITYKTKSQLNKIKNVLYFLNAEYQLMESNNVITLRKF